MLLEDPETEIISIWVWYFDPSGESVIEDHDRYDPAAPVSYDLVQSLWPPPENVLY